MGPWIKSAAGMMPNMAIATARSTFQWVDANMMCPDPRFSSVEQGEISENNMPCQHNVISHVAWQNQVSFKRMCTLRVTDLSMLHWMSHECCLSYACFGF